MLYIINEQNQILFRVDAWDPECEKKAIEFLRSNNLKAVDDRITVNGDRVVKAVAR